MAESKATTSGPSKPVDAGHAKAGEARQVHYAGTPKAHSEIVALVDERRGYQMRADAARDEGKGDGAAAMERRIAQVNQQIRLRGGDPSAEDGLGKAGR